MRRESERGNKINPGLGDSYTSYISTTLDGYVLILGTALFLLSKQTIPFSNTATQSQSVHSPDNVQ